MLDAADSASARLNKPTALHTEQPFAFAMTAKRDLHAS